MADGSQVNLKLTPGEIVIAAGAIVTLIFSFFHFYSYPSGPSVRLPNGTTIGGGGGGGVSAWGKGLIPVATLIVLLTVVMGVQIILTKVFNLDLGPGIAGFTWVQVHLALGFFAAVDAVAFLLVAKPGDTGVGLIFMLIGSIACLVGAVLLSRERAST
jgi:hypothetical protein